ncbi:hypothetical protein [Nocardia shimofusensis]|uniref:hypothetical protein n=1 Tax=Nocardia shimofusensis TaxID=228596 RepID=UPI0008329AC9|nr:hypothetical protein [Nocardia shimofusensis]
MWHDFAEQTFGATLYDPGHYGDDLDRRWESAEGAQAWVLQCLTQASESGSVVVLMPSAALANAQARPLRSSLLRRGVLRAIVTRLAAERDLWVLGESDGERHEHVLLLDANGDRALVSSVWEAFRSDPAHPEAARYVVRAVDRLDERVDLSPADAHTLELDHYPALWKALVDGPEDRPPVLERAESDAAGGVTLGELAEAGMVVFHQSPPTVATAGTTPMWTAKDVRLGRGPSRHGDGQAAGAVICRAGDVVVIAEDVVVRVCGEDGALLGPGIELVRVESEALVPDFLAGVLRAAIEAHGSGGTDLYQVEVPRLSPSDQREYARAFDRLRKLEDGWHRRRAAIEQMVRLGYLGLATARLRPVDTGE